MLRCLLALVLCCALNAAAHKPSDSYLTLDVRDAAIEGQWDIALRDLDFALNLDVDQNGAITWGEVRSRHEEIGAYALARLALRSKNDACASRVESHAFDHHSDGGYAVLRFTAICSRPIDALEVRYTLFSDLDPQHKGLLSIRHASGGQTAILSADHALQTISFSAPNGVRQFYDYVVHGIWHIWIGFDHILFLVSLLLPAVFLRRQRMWTVQAKFRPAFWDVAKVVTAFTLAHSFTLTAAALGVIEMPSRWVESTIAASVVLAALNNVYPIISERRWLMAFAFGLIHGFGFASVLSDLGLPQHALLSSLIAFNVGVEIGQLAIVCAFFPVAWWLRHGWFYRRLVFTAGSMLIAFVAIAWFAERAFDLKFVA